MPPHKVYPVRNAKARASRRSGTVHRSTPVLIAVRELGMQISLVRTCPHIIDTEAGAGEMVA